MPGVHTFYDGSKVLEPFVPILGFDCDKLNLLVCQISSVFFSIAYYRLLPPSAVSKNLRLVYPMVIGIFFCYFCYGSAIKHILGLLCTCYFIIKFLPTRYVHEITFVFSMGYLVLIHWFRWYILTEYYIDVTGALMIMVQKTTMLAFSLHDGIVKKQSDLNELQTREAIRKVPSPLEYFSYMFQFQTVLTGPLSFYADYTNFITGTNFRGIKRPNPYPAAAKKLAIVSVCVVLLLLFSKDYTPAIIVDADNIQWHSLKWWLVFYFMMFMHRVPYYYAWIFADANCNLSGFGLEISPNGEQNWDLLSNVDIWKVEMGLNFKETLDGWNCGTMRWLRRVAYDRVSIKYRTVCTYLVSAVWHGFFIGYYMTFLTGAIMTSGARRFRRCVRRHFQRNIWLSHLYDLITFVATKIALIYTVFPFVVLHFYPALFLYRKLYFFYHVLALTGILILPKILTPISSDKSDDKTE